MCGAVGVMLLHLTVIILTARDAGRLQAIPGQKRKQTLTRFLADNNQWMVREHTVGCEPTLLALSQHRLTFCVAPL